MDRKMEAEKLDRCYGDSRISLAMVSAETERNHNNDGTLLQNAAVFKTFKTHKHSHAHARWMTASLHPNQQHTR
ncbi:hypothetical protein PAMP_016854 [Pampus punctatissimus]